MGRLEIYLQSRLAVSFCLNSIFVVMLGIPMNRKTIIPNRVVHTRESATTMVHKMAKANVMMVLNVMSVLILKPRRRS
jgi:hypothetical protein